MTLMNKINNIVGNLNVTASFLRTSKSPLSSGNPCGSYVFQMGLQHLKPPTIATVTKYIVRTKEELVEGVKHDRQFLMSC